MTDQALNVAEERVVRASLAHMRQHDAAKDAAMSLRTFQRISAREHVQAEISRRAMRRLRAAVVGLARHAEAAADALGKMANGELPPHGARVRACDAVLTHVARAIEIEDLEARLRELELAAAAGASGLVRH